MNKRFKDWMFPDIQHGIPTQYGWVVYYPKLFNIQRYVDIGWGCFINAKYGIEIEEDVQIGPYCVITSDNTINNTRGKIKICKGARIGAYSLILPNSIIEENEFIRARSIINEKC